MTSEAQRLINVFLEYLSDNDKNEVLKFLQEYNDSSKIEKTITKTRLLVNKLTLEPVSTYGCPFCGT